MAQVPPTASQIQASLYPESDGQPMADNTLQYRWIVRLVTNLQHLLRDKTAFVAGDLFWYPVLVDHPPVPVQAPDVMVVLGRPAGDRGSYKQWEEENIGPQVVFEIISPSNTTREMTAKRSFYDKYGVLEMFFYDPESCDFWGFARSTTDVAFELVTPLNLPWVSPTLGIRFELSDIGLMVFYPDGKLFEDPGDVIQERDQANLKLSRALETQQETQAKLEQALAKLKELGIDPEQL